MDENTTRENQPTICGRSFDEFLNALKHFHGSPAPGAVIGGFMVDLAQEHVGSGVEADVIVETIHCLPDAVQILTPCTIGNGWLKIIDWNKFALTLYDKRTLEGIRVWIDLRKAQTVPDIFNWYMRLVPKRDLPLDILLERIRNAGRKILSFAPVRVTQHHEKIDKGDILTCSGCGEAYAAGQGNICLACQGKGYYEQR